MAQHSKFTIFLLPWDSKISLNFSGKLKGLLFPSVTYFPYDAKRGGNFSIFLLWHTLNKSFQVRRMHHHI